MPIRCARCSKPAANKQGVTVVVAGHEVAMAVTEIAGDYVIGRNQQDDRIVVRVDRIDAALK